jgi:hypothetical protein
LDGGRQSLGHDLKKAIEVGQFIGSQEAEHSSHSLLPGALNLGEQADALVAELAVDNATVVGSVASDDKAAALNSINQLGRSGVGHAQLVRELAN